MKPRLYKKRIYRLVEITCEILEVCSNQLHDKKIQFFKSILSKEGLAFLDVVGEPSPVLLCFRHSRDQHGQETETFLLVSSDKAGRATELDDWLEKVRARFRGSEFKFDTRFPENLQKFKEGMRVFKKTP